VENLAQQAHVKSHIEVEVEVEHDEAVSQEDLHDACQTLAGRKLGDAQSTIVVANVLSVWVRG
jgi:hypothetical protein